MAVYNFTARATDSSGAYADRAFNITVNNTSVDKFVHYSFANGLNSSANGTTWTNRGGGSTSISYLNGQWVMLTGANTIYTSPDAVTWTQVTSVSGMSASRTTAAADFIGYNGTYYLAGYQSGTVVVVYKNNTLTGAWTLAYTSGAITIGNTDYLTTTLKWHSALNLWILTLGYTQGGGSGGSNGGIYTSPDGVTWTNRFNPGNTYYPTCQASANGLYLVGYLSTSGASGNTTNGFVIMSTDGISWNSSVAATMPGASRTEVTSIAYGNGVWVLGARSNNDTRIFYSFTGRPGSWTQGTGLTIGSSPDYTYPAYKLGVSFYNGLFVTINSNSNGQMNTSTDGINWSNAGTGPFTQVHKLVTIDGHSA